jgi:mono/diheme cytochrome c family protein
MTTDEGKSVFDTFCAGCHGFNGISYFVSSPSFALGERMEKTDGELFRSISAGRGAMPGWGGKLADEQIRSVLAYVRGLQRRVEQGITVSLHSPPSMFFVFRPSQQIGPWPQTPLPAYPPP